MSKNKTDIDIDSGVSAELVLTLRLQKVRIKLLELRGEHWVVAVADFSFDDAFSLKNLPHFTRHRYLLQRCPVTEWYVLPPRFDDTRKNIASVLKHRCIRLANSWDVYL